MSYYNKNYPSPRHGFEIKEESLSDVLSEPVAFSIKSMLGRVFGRSNENDISYTLDSLSQLHPAYDSKNYNTNYF